MHYIGLFYTGSANESLHTVTNHSTEINKIIEELKQLGVKHQLVDYDEITVGDYFGDEAGIVKVVSSGHWPFGFVSRIQR